MPTIIKFKIPYGKLIERNGLKTCLKVVPGTRQYLTHNKHYGNRERRIEEVIKEQERTLYLNRCPLKELT